MLKVKKKIGNKDTSIEFYNFALSEFVYILDNSKFLKRMNEDPNFEFDESALTVENTETLKELIQDGRL